MKIYDQTSEICESEHINGIFNYLDNILDDDWGLYIRQYNQPQKKFLTKNNIVIILSAEGHSYLPPEINDENVKAVFMNYLKKKNSNFPHFFNPYDFDRYPKLFELQLGTTKWFSGNNNINILDRACDVSFIGQYDQYTRVDFYQSLNKIKINNSIIHFYEGWNKGVGPEIYSQVMSNTKVALVPCGSASLDTFRFYEAMKCGCIVLTLNQNKYEFMSGSPHLEIKSWANINDFLDNIFIDASRMKNLSTATASFWNDNLSPIAAAKFILSKIK